MASERLFQDIPPFPDDTPTANTCTVSLADLNKKDPSAMKSMFDSCQRLGFFQLDLHEDVLGETMMQETEMLWDLMKVVMNLPDEVKSAYSVDLPKTMMGFKPRGSLKTEANEPDRCDGLNIGHDGLLGIPPLQPLPSEVLAHRDLLISYLQHGRQILSLVCEILAIQLQLPPSTFTSLQSPSRPSNTMLRLPKSAASLGPEDMRTSLGAHTDLGTVTLLTNVIGGLQILAPDKSAGDTDAWLYTRPRPGCLIVNLGDAMVQWTGGRLRSNCHRIYYAPGEQRLVDRYSMAILFRPEHNASMKSLMSTTKGSGEIEEGDITATEWEMKMVARMKTGTYVPHSKGGTQVAVH